MATAPKTHAEAVRIKLPEDEHGTRTIRGVGFRAVCECGYKSRTSGSMAVARNASREHARHHEAQSRASVSGPV